MDRGALIFLILLSLDCAAPTSDEPAPLIQGGYSTKPLERAVFDPVHVALDSMVFNNWLNANYSSLDTESMKGAREHLYYLIDSWVKSIYARDNVVFPVGSDAVLQILFSWSERLGVLGGRLVHEALKASGSPEAPAVMPVPTGFSLSLRNDMLVLTSEGGRWSFGVPYYFMIWNITEFEATGGPKTQVVYISTGAALHDGQDGHSQASLMLLSAPEPTGVSLLTG